MDFYFCKLAFYTVDQIKVFNDIVVRIKTCIVNKHVFTVQYTVLITGSVPKKQ